MGRGQADDFLLRVAEHLGKRRVDRQDALLGVGDDEDGLLRWSGLEQKWDEKE